MTSSTDSVSLNPSNFLGIQKSNILSLSGSTSRAQADTLELQAYIKLLPSSIWSFLFSNSATSQAIIRSLNELDQQIIIRLCYLNQNVSERTLRWWLQPESISELRKSITSLLQSHILISRDASSNSQQHLHHHRSELTQYSLNPLLKKQLHSILLNGPSDTTLPYIKPVEQIENYIHKSLHSYKIISTKQKLINHSKQRWDNLLRFVVSPNAINKNSPNHPTNSEPIQDFFLLPSSFVETPPERPCDEVVMLLVRRKLISFSAAYSFGTSHTPVSGMSREAFSWLLKDLRSQINSLIMEFLFMIDGGNLTTPGHQAELRSNNFSPSGRDTNIAISSFQLNDLLLEIIPEIVECRPPSLKSHQSNSTVISSNSSNDQSNIASKPPFKTSLTFSSSSSLSNLSSSSSPPSTLDYISKSSQLIQEVLLALLAWSQASIGQVFYVSSLTEIQKKLLRVCDALGLTLWEKQSSPIYIIAPYCLLLRFDSSETKALTSAMTSISQSLSNPLRKRDMYSPFSIGSNSRNSITDIWFHPYLRDQKFEASLDVNSSSKDDEYQSTSSNNLFNFTSSSSAKKSLTTDLNHLDNSSSNSKNIDSTSININEGNRLNNVSNSTGTDLVPRPVSTNLESGIIVQSNFKVYIYTSSELHISVLSHLCELQARTTNLVVGLLSRDSVSAAYKSGITADQIIRFLESHSHPALYDRLMNLENNHSSTKSITNNTQNPYILSTTSTSNITNSFSNQASFSQNQPQLLPENVIIQLRMWEAEQHRLTMESAVLFKRWQQDLLPELFQRSVRWALGKGYCLYYTHWTEDTSSEEFETWMKKEKYLCVNLEAKSEMIEKIREVRDLILQHRSEANDQNNNM